MTEIPYSAPDWRQRVRDEADLVARLPKHNAETTFVLYGVPLQDQVKVRQAIARIAGNEYLRHRVARTRPVTRLEVTLSP